MNESSLEGQVGGDHYIKMSPQPISVILAWKLDFTLGNAVKYIARAGKKEGVPVEQDIKKAIHYLQLHLDHAC